MAKISLVQASVIADEALEKGAGDQLRSTYGGSAG
jgi:hypothetical protein